MGWFFGNSGKPTRTQDIEIVAMASVPIDSKYVYYLGVFDHLENLSN